MEIDQNRIDELERLKQTYHDQLVQMNVTEKEWDYLTTHRSEVCERLGHSHSWMVMDETGSKWVLDSQVSQEEKDLMDYLEEFSDDTFLIISKWYDNYGSQLWNEVMNHLTEMKEQFMRETLSLFTFLRLRLDINEDDEEMMDRVIGDPSSDSSDDDDDDWGDESVLDIIFEVETDDEGDSNEEVTEDGDHTTVDSNALGENQ